MLKESEEEKRRRFLSTSANSPEHTRLVKLMSSQVKSEKRLYVGNLATSVDEQVVFLAE